MAIAFDATAQATATSTSLTYAHTCTGSNLILIVGVNFYNPGTDDITGVTYNTVAMTQIAKVTHANAGTSYLYYLINPATGANNVVVSKTGSAVIRSCSASYTGAKQSAQPDASGTNTATGVISVAKSVTTIADNCWMVSFSFNDANLCIASTGTTLRNDGGTYMAIGDSNVPITPAGAYSMAWTLASGTANWTIVNASIAPPAGTNYTKEFNETITMSDTLVKAMTKTFIESAITLSDTIQKAMTKAFSETITLSEVFSKIKGMFRTFTETEIVISDTFQKDIAKVFTETVSITDTISKAITRIFTETSITITDTLEKAITKTLDEVVNITDSITRTITKTISETINITDSLIKSITKTFSETISITDWIEKIWNKIGRLPEYISSLLKRKGAGFFFEHRNVGASPTIKPDGTTLSKDKPGIGRAGSVDKPSKF